MRKHIFRDLLLGFLLTTEILDSAKSSLNEPSLGFFPLDSQLSNYNSVSSPSIPPLTEGCWFLITKDAICTKLCIWFWSLTKQH